MGQILIWITKNGQCLWAHFGVVLSGRFRWNLSASLLEWVNLVISPFPYPLRPSCK
jgi:hypothetical protein